MIKDKKAMREYLAAYYFVPKELEDEFDGEISIIMIEASYRKKGLRKSLITEVFKMALNDGM